MDTSAGDISDLSTEELFKVAEQMAEKRMQEKQQEQQQQSNHAQQNRSFISNAGSTSFIQASQAMMNMVPYAANGGMPMQQPPAAASRGGDNNERVQEYFSALYQLQQQKAAEKENEARIGRELKRGIGPELIEERKDGNASVSYISTATAIDLANEVFGYNGWSSEIVSQSCERNPVGGGRWDCYATALVRVTLRDGSYHQESGHHALKNQPCQYKGAENASKSASSDALKRCLKNFGRRLGNSLYDKFHVKNIKGLRKQPRRFDVDSLYRGEQFEEDMRRQQEQSTKAIENAAWTKDKAGPSNDVDRTRQAHQNNAVAPMKRALPHQPMAAPQPPAKRANTGAPPKPAAPARPMPPRRSDTCAPNRPPQVARPDRVEPIKSDAKTVQDSTEYDDFSGGTFDDEGIDAELVFSQLHESDDFWDTLGNEALDKIDAIEKTETSASDAHAFGGNERARGPVTNKPQAAAMAKERVPLRPHPAPAQKHAPGDQSKTSPPQINSSKTSAPPSDGPRDGNNTNQSNPAPKPALQRTPTGRFVNKPVPVPEVPKLAGKTVEEVIANAARMSPMNIRESTAQGVGKDAALGSDDFTLSPQRRNIQELRNAREFGPAGAANEIARRSYTPYSPTKESPAHPLRSTPRRAVTSGAVLRSDVEQTANAARAQERTVQMTNGRPLAAVANRQPGQVNRSPNTPRRAPARNLALK